MLCVNCVAEIQGNSLRFSGLWRDVIDHKEIGLSIKARLHLRKPATGLSCSVLGIDQCACRNGVNGIRRFPVLKPIVAKTVGFFAIVVW